LLSLRLELKNYTRGALRHFVPGTCSSSTGHFKGGNPTRIRKDTPPTATNISCLNLREAR
jgi:hypothetical protein